MNWPKFLTKPFEKKSDASVEEKKPLGRPRKNPIVVVDPTKTVEKVEVHKELTEEMKLALIDLIAQGYGPTMCSRKMGELYGVQVQPGNVQKYKMADKWKPVIKELRAKYRENIHDVEMSSKATRLRLTEYAAERAVEKDDLSVVLKAVATARLEFEGKDGDTNIYVNNPVYNELNVLSTDELLRRKAEATKRLTQLEEAE